VQERQHLQAQRPYGPRASSSGSLYLNLWVLARLPPTEGSPAKGKDTWAMAQQQEHLLSLSAPLSTLTKVREHLCMHEHQAMSAQHRLPPEPNRLGLDGGLTCQTGPSLTPHGGYDRNLDRVKRTHWNTFCFRRGHIPLSELSVRLWRIQQSTSASERRPVALYIVSCTLEYRHCRRRESLLRLHSDERCRI
jgi:hypothetical protein